MDNDNARSRLNRFQRDNRLMTAAAYGRVFEKASRSRDKWFTVICRDNGMNRPRLGLAISKKHCRKATTRNLIKRIARESFRRHQAELGGLDIVVMNQPAAGRATRRQLSESLDGHWQRCVAKTSVSGKQE